MHSYNLLWPIYVRPIKSGLKVIRMTRNLLRIKKTVIPYFIRMQIYLHLFKLNPDNFREFTGTQSNDSILYSAVAMLRQNV